MRESSPWYAGGVRFRCTACGACCTGGHGWVWVTPAEAARLAAGLGLSLDAFGRRYLRRIGARLSLLERTDGACVFYRTADRRCAVYDDRPTQCRAYPFWPAIVASRERFEREAAACPGIGEPEVVEAADIERRLAGARSAPG